MTARITIDLQDEQVQNILGKSYDDCEKLAQGMGEDHYETDREIVAWAKSFMLYMYAMHGDRWAVIVDKMIMQRKGIADGE